jgi:periplasmic divalent cation tolerance protein
MSHLAVFTTVASEEEARSLAATILSRRLAACVQVSEIESHYEWQGELQRDREYRLLCKTRSALYTELERVITEQHSYELPAIYALPMAPVSAAFAAWIDDNTRP